MLVWFDNLFCMADYLASALLQGQFVPAIACNGMLQKESYRVGQLHPMQAVQGVVCSVGAKPVVLIQLTVRLIIPIFNIMRFIYNHPLSPFK